MQRVSPALSNQNYLSLFRRESLVYVTQADGREMREFDSSVVYVVGGFPLQTRGVNRCAHAKAKREGVACVRLPFGEFNRCGSVPESLSLSLLLAQPQPAQPQPLQTANARHRCMCCRSPESTRLRLDQLLHTLLLVRERWQAAAPARGESALSQRRATHLSPSLTRGESAGLANRLPLMRHPHSFVSAVWSDAIRRILRRAPDDAATKSSAMAFAGARPLRAHERPHTLPLGNTQAHVPVRFAPKFTR